MNWCSRESYFLTNERDPQSLKKPDYDLPGHIWLQTSGSESKKWVALSKEALLSSAESVNSWLEASSKDIWLKLLPEFHVGGLSILARSYLSGSKVSNAAWNPFIFDEIQATLSSLVPAQVYDLVKLNIKAPSSLRAVFVGGAALDPTLYEEARALGWPLIPTFGMTEASSQIATGDPLYILPHLEAKISEAGYLMIKGASLFSGYYRDHFFDPKVDGWFTTEDRVEKRGRELIPLGRASDLVKIGGELISIPQLEKHLRTLIEEGEAVLMARPDLRLGRVMELVHTFPDAAPVIEKFNASVIPLAKIRASKFIESLPKSPLGKVLKSGL